MLVRASRQIRRYAPSAHTMQGHALSTSSVRRCGAGPIYDDIEEKIIVFGEEGATPTQPDETLVANLSRNIQRQQIPRANPFTMGMQSGVLKRGFASKRGTLTANLEQQAVAEALEEEDKDYVRAWMRSTYGSGFRDSTLAGMRTNTNSEVLGAEKEFYGGDFVRTLSQDMFNEIKELEQRGRMHPETDAERAFVDACWDYFDFRQEGAIDYFQVEAAYRRAGKQQTGLETAGESVARLLVEAGLTGAGGVSVFSKPMLKAMDLIRAVKTGALKLNEKNQVTGPELSRWALSIVDKYAAGMLSSERFEQVAALQRGVQPLGAVPTLEQSAAPVIAKQNLLEHIQKQAQAAGGAAHAAKVEYELSRTLSAKRRADFVRRLSATR